MPEGPEVETERLHEAIHEEVEKEEHSPFLKQIALTTAVLAAFAAVSSLRAGGTVNEALRLETAATRLQAEASDQWAYYQAKGVKGAVAEASRSAWLAAGKEDPEQLAKKIERYGEEQKEIMGKAKELEAERDAKTSEAEHLMHLHHRYAYAVALLQVAIALGAVAALTRARPVWFGSLAVGVIGIGLFAVALAGG
ncbi:MAG TPA: DUF4337 domain-containing protein [Anaeromyxobacteraceae bacterium]|nr:DUF4337 domain-containing protein [Anaeromyxobacteraceae bacterium]